jgi:hypothetical protein
MPRLKSRELMVGEPIERTTYLVPLDSEYYRPGGPVAEVSYDMDSMKVKMPSGVVHSYALQSEDLSPTKAKELVVLTLDRIANNAKYGAMKRSYGQTS